MEYLIIGIFIITYIFISVRRVSKIKIERPAIALLGGIAMIAAGGLSASDAISAIDLHTIFLLLGMMLIVSALEISGFFNYATVQMARLATSQLHLLTITVLLTALLSALFLNDAVVLLLTPIIVKVTRTLKVDPIPYLVGEAMASNIGSVATPIGNPQNAYIAMKSGIPFTHFVAYLFPIAVLSLVVEIIVLCIVFQKELKKPIAPIKSYKHEMIHGMHPKKAFQMISILKILHAGEIKNQRLLVFTLAIFICVFLGFIFSSSSLPISIVAIAGGTLVFALAQPICRVSSKDIMKNVDWGILIFFAGLFILLKGVENTLLIAYITNYFSANPTIFNLSFVTALISNLISNVPAVMLLTPASGVIPNTYAFYLTLAAVSTLAGNATLLGAAANIIVAEVALGYGTELKFKKFLVAGLPVTILTTLIATFYLNALFP